VIAPRDDWPTTVAEARAVQESLAGRVIAEDRFGPIRRVAGADVGFEGPGRAAMACAAVVVLSFPALAFVEERVVRAVPRFPYVPGYLSFRELPVLTDALAGIAATPDLILCDGHGLAHPRRFGLACHLGVALGIPTIGVAKSILVGTHGALGAARGATAPLVDKGETIGLALRTRTGTRPVYVSVGHRVSLASAAEFVLACTPRYRLPETTRRADALSRRRD
jgi:deoxyribonuclease V